MVYIENVVKVKDLGYSDVATTLRYYVDVALAIGSQTTAIWLACLPVGRCFRKIWRRRQRCWRENEWLTIYRYS
jgi:hypothetical protein